MATSFNTPLILVVAVICGLAGGFLGAQFSSGDERRAFRSERYDDGELRAEIEALREEIRRSRTEVAVVQDRAVPEAPGEPSATAESDGEHASASELPAWIRDFKPSGYVESLGTRKFDAKARDKLFTLLSVHKEKIDETIKGLLAAVEKDAGNADKARTMWKRGTEQYPDNKAIRDALELIGEK